MSDENYKAALREFMAERGSMVGFHDQKYGGEPEPSVYGWQDFEALKHVNHGACSWVVPEGSVLTEQTYSQFQDTFVGNHDEVGVNVKGAYCSCGAYRNVTLRYRGSFEDVLFSILGGKGDRPHLVL